MPFQHPSEELVYRLCHRSFLSLWSYANPKHPTTRKELCDVLTICDPHVLVFSVKEVALSSAVNASIAATRWLRKAVEGSVKQIYGAERSLRNLEAVTRQDGTKGLPLPTAPVVHRISVSLGGEGAVSLPFGDFGKGFVHVLDEHALWAILGELDTITDFVDYLGAKEELYAQRPKVRWGGEEDLLAIYVHSGRRFPERPEDVVIIEPGAWQELTQKPEYQRRVAADASSRAWDHLIEYLSESLLAGNVEVGEPLRDSELVLRTMARERRFNRRVLADSFLEFMDLATRRRVRARICPSPSGVVYVFFNAPPDVTREARVAELSARCFVARSLISSSKVIVGIGTNREPAVQGYATDVVYMEIPEWTAERQAQADMLKKDAGLFAAPLMSSQHIEEYPPS